MCHVLVLTWNNEISNFCVSICERIEDPPTGNKESLVAEVIGVGEGIEAVDPESELVELGPVEPGVDLQPVGGHEAGGDEDNHDEAEAEGNIPGQGPLPVGVSVGKEVIIDTLSLSHDGGLLDHSLTVHRRLWDNFHNKCLAVGVQDGECWRWLECVCVR